MKLLSRPMNLLIAIFISLAINYSFNSSAQAQEINSIQNQLASERSPNSTQKNKLDFSGDGRPGKRKGGGSRSPCPISETPLRALVPKNNIGNTVSDRPSLWFYVPYNPQEVGRVEFVLQDESENDVYRQTFVLAKTPGLVNLKLPQAAPPLAEEGSYHWYFKLYCNNSPSASTNFVEGWIKRIPLHQNLAARIRQKKAPLYEEYGRESVWYDSLDSLAKLRLSSDTPMLESDWNKLLSAEGVDLGEIMHEPLTGKIFSTMQSK